MQGTQEMWVRAPRLEDPLEEKMATIPVFLPGKFHAQKNLEVYSPWGHKQLDMAEHTCMQAISLCYFPMVALAS